MGSLGSDLKGTQPRWGHRGVGGAQGVKDLGLKKAEAEYKGLTGTVTGPWWQRGWAADSTSTPMGPEHLYFSYLCTSFR